MNETVINVKKIDPNRVSAKPQANNNLNSNMVQIVGQATVQLYEPHHLSSQFPEVLAASILEEGKMMKIMN
jgi:hypothetical protein